MACFIMRFVDVVISAPYGGSGGVLYLYHGSTDGLVEPPAQVRGVLYWALRVCCKGVQY